MSNPQNQQFWNQIAKRSTEIQQDFWYGAEKLAKFLNDNPAQYSRYMTYDMSKPDPSWPWWKTALFYIGQSQYNQSVTSYNSSQIILEKSSWLWGMLQGDFNKNPSMSQLIVGGLISLIPVVDQVCDVRDLIANSITLSDEKSRNTENYMALALTSIGVIPEVGSAIKSVVQLRKAKDFSKIKLFKTMEHYEEVLSKFKVNCPWGKAPEAWLRSKPWKAMATRAYNALKNNINRILTVINECLKKFNGALRNALVRFQATLNHILKTIKQYIDKLCDEVERAMASILPQPPLAMAGVGNTGKHNTPTGRYEANVGSGKKTEVTNKQKKEVPEKEKPKDKDINNPCTLRPYKPDTCKPQGKTGHHVVPDRAFRLGLRTDTSNRIPGAITEGQGLVVCVTGKGRQLQHGQIHSYYDKKERVLGKVSNPKGVTTLEKLELIGAISVSKVLKCNKAILLAELRTYHLGYGMGPDFKVTADPTGKMSIDSNIFRPASNTKQGGKKL